MKIRAADYLQLFDKTLADAILSMNQDEAINFLKNNNELLKEKNRTPDYYFETVFDESAKESIVFDFCLEGGTIPLDYWGCAAHFDYFEGSISYLDLFPEGEEELFKLLSVETVNEIIKSLETHKTDLKVKTVDKIIELKDFCASNRNYLAAYFYDF